VSISSINNFFKFLYNILLGIHKHITKFWNTIKKLLRNLVNILFKTKRRTAGTFIFIFCIIFIGVYCLYTSSQSNALRVDLDALILYSNNESSSLLHQYTKTDYIEVHLLEDNPCILFGFTVNSSKMDELKDKKITLAYQLYKTDSSSNLFQLNNISCAYKSFNWKTPNGVDYNKLLESEIDYKMINDDALEIYLERTNFNFSLPDKSYHFKITFKPIDFNNSDYLLSMNIPLYDDILVIMYDRNVFEKAVISLPEERGILLSKSNTNPYNRVYYLSNKNTPYKVLTSLAFSASIGFAVTSFFGLLYNILKPN